MSFDHAHQELLDKLATAARLTADACQEAAHLHLQSRSKDVRQYAKLREDIAEHLNLLHDLLPQHTDEPERAA